MWAALSAFFVVFLVIIAGAVIWASANIMSFLQPILIPVAIAAILAYLLDPLVSRMCKRGFGRTRAIALIFLMAFVALGGLVWWLVPTISMQSANFAKELPGYTQKARDYVVDRMVWYNRTFSASSCELVAWSAYSAPIACCHGSACKHSRAGNNRARAGQDFIR